LTSAWHQSPFSAMSSALRAENAICNNAGAGCQIGS
jgi:hypothetical protein